MNLTAALFVGGESKRMGRDKALVEISGAPLWSRQIQLLRDLQPDEIVLSCARRPGWCPEDVVPVMDEVQAQGPLGGLTAVLTHVKSSHLLALAVDLPKMNAELLRQLWSFARPGCGVVPVMEESFEPLCAIYPREALAAARGTFERGERSMQKFIRDLLEAKMISTWLVPVDSASLFLNANTPADLKRL